MLVICKHNSHSCFVINKTYVASEVSILSNDEYYRIEDESGVSRWFLSINFIKLDIEREDKINLILE